MKRLFWSVLILLSLLGPQSGCSKPARPQTQQNAPLPTNDPTSLNHNLTLPPSPATR
jgi:hypothetical protein